jgi:hypothetical protein
VAQSARRIPAADAVCEPTLTRATGKLGAGQQEVGNLLRRVDHQPVPVCTDFTVAWAKSPAIELASPGVKYGSWAPRSEQPSA